MDIKKLDPVQLLAGGMSVNPDVQTVFVPSTISTSSASATSATVTASSITASGGQIGPNGLMTIEAIGQINNNSGGVIVLTAGATTAVPVVHSVTSGNYPAGGNTGALYYKMTLWNQNSETGNVLWDYLTLSDNSPTAPVSTSTPQITTLDTTVDIVWNLDLKLSTIADASWMLYAIRTTTAYGPLFT